jgi:hypothetical protein
MQTCGTLRMDRDPAPFLFGGLALATVSAWRAIKDIGLMTRKIRAIDRRVPPQPLPAMPPTEQAMMSLFRGQIDLSSVLPILIGVLYAGSGGWTERRWETALLIMGYSAANKVGYMRGYWTDNPAFRRRPGDDEGEL